MTKKSGLKNVGRPRIPDEKKHKVVTFTASPDLVNDIDKKANQLFGGNKTKYIVHKLTQKGGFSGKKNGIEVEKIELYKLIKEVNKIGSNINQIARRTNLGYRRDEPLKKSLAINQEKLDELITLMNRIVQSNNPNFR
tara:strand:+ start:325 stop:738 length:414 start_codon:yes stop_codon:yes gene_type:complete